MGGRRVKSLKARVRWELCISRDGPGSTVEVCKLEKSEEEDTVLVAVDLQKKQGRCRVGSSRSESCLGRT